MLLLLLLLPPATYPCFQNGMSSSVRDTACVPTTPQRTLSEAEFKITYQMHARHVQQGQHWTWCNNALHVLY
jgi:hypothetical protein